MQLNPRYIKDAEGKDFVILPSEEFDALIEDLEDMEDVYLYDTAKINDSGERIPMKEVFEKIDKNNAQ